jgi:hypothetical protein
VRAFNRIDPSAVPQHRMRMRLLLTTPALAISLSAYEQWLLTEDQPFERLLDQALDSAVRYFGA